MHLLFLYLSLKNFTIGCKYFYPINQFLEVFKVIQLDILLWPADNILGQTSNIKIALKIFSFGWMADIWYQRLYQEDVLGLKVKLNFLVIHWNPDVGLNPPHPPTPEMIQESEYAGENRVKITT